MFPFTLTKSKINKESRSIIQNTNQREKPRLEGLLLRECKRGFIAHCKHFTYKVKLVKSSYLGQFMFPFVQKNARKNKKCRLRILTP